MVSYYNSAAMYRHQQAVAANPNGHFQAQSPMHSWYTAAGYHQTGPMSGGHPGSYCGMQDDQQMWHPHSHPSVMFHNEFQDFVHGGGGVPMQPQHPHQQMDTENHQLPSPPITVSGSEMSSPGAGSGNISPPNNVNSQNTRPAPVRSPYEWIKKTSYQSQPNPEQECVNSHPVLLDYSAQECHGKTRTKDKYRVVYTDHQRIELEKEFTFNNKYITIRRKSELAQNLGLSERQIKIWFQNRRAKERKQNKKRVEEKNQLDMTGMSSPYQQNIINQHTHHLHHHQHMDLNNHHQQHHEILPTIVPSSSTVMSRFMKIENSAEETDPLG